VGLVLAEDRALLARLRKVNTAVADVVVDLLQHLDGGELPSEALRTLGERFGELGRDLIDHADRRDATIRYCDDQPAIAMCDSVAMCDSPVGRRPELRRW
jgi:hypothetical protein